MIFDKSVNSPLSPARPSFEPAIKTSVNSISDLCEQYKQIWWSCKNTFPEFQNIYSTQAQTLNEKILNNLTNDLLPGLERLPNNPDSSIEWVSKFKPGIKQFVSNAFS